MKKHDFLSRILILFFCIAGLQTSNANPQLIVQNDKDIYFFENGEMIFPAVDYSRVYILFSEDKTAQNINQLQSEVPSLKALAADENGFASNRSASFHLQTTKVEEARQIIRSIRQMEGIASVYPFLIRGKDIASVHNQVLVNISNDQLAAFLKSTNDIRIIEKLKLGISTSLIIEVPQDESVFQYAGDLSASGLVNYAQPDFVFRGISHFEPDDPYYSSQWFLNQNNDADIDAAEAWDITQGNLNSVVAVIDGNGYDLQAAEMTGKYLSPYCAVNDNNDPSASHPDENHGTPCAGLIGALTNNGTGVASVGYYCPVMPIRIGHDFNGGSFQTSAVIIQRAAQHVTSPGSDIFAVSNSIGLGTWANIVSVRDAYESMRTQTRNGKGSVILASTGNDDASGQEQYPCFFPNVVGVGATNNSDERAYFSNYGDSCDLVAPGLDLWTLDRTGSAGYIIGDYNEFSGTSAACPVAAGIVGLMGSVFPNYTEGQLRTKLYNACEKVGGYSYNTNPSYPFGTWNNEMGYGRLNAHLAVQGGAQLDPPTNLQANLNGSDVSLTWDAPGGSGGTEELIYDNNTATGAYSYEGFTMATHMSPSEACKLLTIKFYTTTDPGDNTFDAKVFGWNGSQPGTTVLYERTCTAVDDDWFALDVSSFNLNFIGDFVVGFGSINATTYLGYDANLNNGRSWDLDESSQSWSSWSEAYLIRAVVEYSDGSREELQPGPAALSKRPVLKNVHTDIQSGENPQAEPIPNQMQTLMGLLGYNVYRNGSKINASVVTNTAYNDNGLASGTYNYSVTAVYDEGESSPAGPVEVTVQGSSLPAPTNLQATNNNQNVNLSWTGVGGGNEEWISYNDGTFENSFASTNGGQGLAQLFTLPETPSTLKEVRFWVSDYQNYGADIDVYILSGDGSNVLHGPITVGGEENEWVSTAIPDLVINQSTFMVATYNVNPDGPYVGVDENNYDGTLYFGNHTDGFTEMSEYDYYYVGSHEAYIEYNDGSQRNETILSPVSVQANASKLSSSGEFSFDAKSGKLESQERGFLNYRIYRNGSFLGTATQTNYSDVLPQTGTYAYTVTANYDEGESDPAGPVSVTWSGGGSTVTVSGLVKDATTGGPVADALVTIAGLSDYSDSQGNYSISDVPSGALTADYSANPQWGVVPLTVQFTDLSGYGKQTLTCSKAGYVTYEDDHVSVPPDIPLNYDINLSPQLSTGEMRFVLSWQATPPDLDLHLLTPDIEGTNYHIYWDEMGSADQPPYATLDTDEMEGFGPETITIVQMFGGTYKVYVHQYDEDAPLAGSGAMVKIYNENGLLKTVNVPSTGPNDDYYWYICDVNGSNGSVNVFNSLMSEAPGLKNFMIPLKEKNEFVMIGHENNLANWSWDFGDGGSSNEQNPIHTYTTIGTYNVSLTYADGGGQATEVKNAYITVGEQSIAENELSKLTRIYPNPADDIIFMECPFSIKSISIIDMAGQKMFNLRCNAKQKMISIKKLQQGVYTVFLETTKGFVAKKVLIK
ncbi:MAG: S8 family serine peptidase [Bacteroidales bacterium]|nr:S8 family serine peptidase [Bacteroidales bacterium]MCF8387088.1 S8 family serine peptidase [Bacteroidales bacterium]MCF8399042.1 S8 family serine peptidase [Bacteroidales bacterium]